ncbi:MAG TPA: alpha/beta fold hydrolase, partial [Hyphomicrobium sp.]|nr:alpha/beta fold hydrolase [Hyphomicrobium sp.]
MLMNSGARADGMLTDFPYPHPVKQYAFTSQGQQLAMAYMDIAPTGTPNGKTAVLLHGKNFCGATWEGVIDPLAKAGYRVVVPDQIGFGKSDKPLVNYRIRTYVDFLDQFCKQLKIERAT